jgi:glycosyltransferase involved in cell wall biosynthesis
VRILHLTDHYLPVLGGIETHVAALAARHAARGDDVTVLTSTQASADGWHTTDTGPVQVRRARSVLQALRMDFRCYDVVHAHVSVVAPFSSPVAARIGRAGVPTVVTVHSMWNGMGPIPMLHASLSGLRAAPVLWTAVSRVAASQLARQLPGRPHIPLLPNAVDVAPRERPPNDDRPVRLMSTMRIARRKRPHQLLRMFGALRKSTAKPVELVIVGDGPLRPTVEHSVARAGLRDAVTITGRLQPPEVLSSLAGGDLYVAPALLESFGLAALEARCVGLPVVGHSASGMTEFVRDGVEGWLCRSDAEIVDRLRELVDDDGLRRRIADHNRLTPSPMTWENALEHNDAAYRLALSTFGSSVPAPLGA